MASESKAKVIERNRSPRVQIAYDVEHYGSPTTIELPFVMGVMADLAGKSETKEAMKPVRETYVRRLAESAGLASTDVDGLVPIIGAQRPSR